MQICAPPPHPQRTQLGVPGPEMGVRRRLPTGSQTHTVQAPTDSKEEPEKEGIRRQRVVDKVFPNQGGRHAGRMGEEQQEAPGGEGSWARTAQPTGSVEGHTQDPRPGVSPTPMSSPAQGLRYQRGLGQEARGPGGIPSCPETTPCCGAPC